MASTQGATPRLPGNTTGRDPAPIPAPARHQAHDGTTYDPSRPRDYQTLAEDGVDAAYESDKRRDRAQLPGTRPRHHRPCADRMAYRVSGADAHGRRVPRHRTGCAACSTVRRHRWSGRGGVPLAGVTAPARRRRGRVPVGRGTAPARSGGDRVGLVGWLSGFGRFRWCAGLRGGG
jgi:hypothetical protein